MATAVRAAIADGATEIELRDGEILLRPEALDLLSQARRDGARKLSVWTAGALLARPGTAEAVRKAGATQVVVGLFGDSAAAHDYVTATPGHFARVLAGMQASRKAGLSVWVVAPLLRPTFRGLPLMVQKVIPGGVTGVRLWAPGGPDRVQHPLLAPLAVMAQTVRHAAHLLATAGRGCAIDQVPACLLGDVAEFAPPLPRYNARHNGQREPPAIGEFGPACEQCAWRSGCAGQTVDRARLHGWVGLDARMDPPTGAAT